jgi:hypothetical protein
MCEVEHVYEGNGFIGEGFIGENHMLRVILYEDLAVSSMKPSRYTVRGYRD